MQSDTEHRRERAYRFDLMIATDWCERFDVLAEHVKMPKKGRLLEINCGTGCAAIALAATLDEGEVVGTDEDPDRIAIAQSKAGVASTSNTPWWANPSGSISRTTPLTESSLTQVSWIRTGLAQWLPRQFALRATGRRLP